MTQPNGPRVRELREGLGWTQERLARKIRRTRQAISKAEAGKPVSETLMTQVAGALKVEFSEIAEISMPGDAEPEVPREPLRAAS
jgi:transcriptional regulator with XRE-family HTH domain